MVISLQKLEKPSPSGQVLCVMIANVPLTKASSTVKENHRVKSRISARGDYTRTWIPGPVIIEDY